MVTALVLFLLLIQDNVEYEHTRLKATFYLPLLRPTWALFLCWISYACLSGNATYVNSFLSLPIFQVLSKITYSTYLVHVSLMLMHLGSLRTLPYFMESDTVKHHKTLIIFWLWLDCVCRLEWWLRISASHILWEHSGLWHSNLPWSSLKGSYFQWKANRKRKKMSELMIRWLLQKIMYKTALGILDFA